MASGSGMASAVLCKWFGLGVSRVVACNPMKMQGAYIAL